MGALALLTQQNSKVLETWKFGCMWVLGVSMSEEFEKPKMYLSKQIVEKKFEKSVLFSITGKRLIE